MAPAPTAQLYVDVLKSVAARSAYLLAGRRGGLPNSGRDPRHGLGWAEQLHRHGHRRRCDGARLSLDWTVRQISTFNNGANLPC